MHLNQTVTAKKFRIAIVIISLFLPVLTYAQKAEDINLKVVEYHSGKDVKAIRFGNKLMTVSPQDKNVKVWDANTLQYIDSLKFHKETPRLLIDPKRNRLITSGNRNIAVWDLSTLKRIKNFTPGGVGVCITDMKRDILIYLNWRNVYFCGAVIYRLEDLKKIGDTTFDDGNARYEYNQVTGKLFSVINENQILDIDLDTRFNWGDHSVKPAESKKKNKSGSSNIWYDITDIKKMLDITDPDGLLYMDVAFDKSTNNPYIHYQNKAIVLETKDNENSNSYMPGIRRVNLEQLTPLKEIEQDKYRVDVNFPDIYLNTVSRVQLNNEKVSVYNSKGDVRVIDTGSQAIKFYDTQHKPATSNFLKKLNRKITVRDQALVFEDLEGNLIKENKIGYVPGIIINEKRSELLLHHSKDDDAELKAYDILTGELKKNFHSKKFFDDLNGTLGQGGIQYCVLNSSGTIAYCYYDGLQRSGYDYMWTLIAWDLVNGKELFNINTDFNNPVLKYNAADDTLIEASNGINIRNGLNGSIIKKRPLPFKVRSVACNSHINQIITANEDNSVSFWDGKTLNRIARYFWFTNGDILITEDGFFKSTGEATSNILVEYKNRNYPIENFFETFYRPDIVSLALKGKDTSGMATVNILATLKSLPPSITLKQITDSGRKARFRYTIQCSSGGIGDVRVYHNGKLLKSDPFEIAAIKTERTGLNEISGKKIQSKMRALKKKNTSINGILPRRTQDKGCNLSDEIIVDAVHGKNELRVLAFNKNNTMHSIPQVITFTSEHYTPDPKVYALSVGVNRFKDKNAELKYAEKDATDFIKTIKTAMGSIYDNQQIIVTSLTNEECTKKNIRQKINHISNRVRPEDIFVLFVASHGVMHDGVYSIVTHDYNGYLQNSVLITQNELVNFSKQIRSLKQLFILDTCYAGGMDTIITGLYDAKTNVLAKSSGIHLYTSASSSQEALDGYKGNGLFTHTILQGLNESKANKNRDKILTVIELGEFAKSATETISSEIGFRQTPNLINYGNDIGVALDSSIVSIQNPDYSLTLKRADALSDLGNITGAHRYYRAALLKAKTDSEKKRIYASLTVTYFEISDYINARKYCTQLLQIQPENKWGHAWLKKIENKL